MSAKSQLLLCVVCALGTGCLGADDPETDASVADLGAPDLAAGSDASTSDVAIVDADPIDAQMTDARSNDAAPDGGFSADAKPKDSGSSDATLDVGLAPDAETSDAGETVPDAAELDAAEPDADTFDAAPEDAEPAEDSGVDAGHDAAADAGSSDVGVFPPTAEWSWGPIRPSQGRGHGESLWTGQEMMITGGRGGGGSACSVDTLLYAPAIDRWRTLNLNHFQRGFSFVWADDRAHAVSGFSCGLGTDTTGDVTTIHPGGINVGGLPPIPGPRTDSTGAWTGSELLIWGMENLGDLCDTPCVTAAERGMRIDPTVGTWTVMDLNGAPFGGYAVWTGDRLFVWGAGSGGLYDPATDSWSPVASPMWVPEGTRRGMVWTGVEIFVSGPNGTSALYDPLLDSWRMANLAGAPSGSEFYAFWTGSEVLVFGTSAGAHYDPIADTWRAVPTEDSYFPPNLRTGNAVWTGTELLVFGGTASLVPNSGRGAKYGPQMIEDPTCVDTSSDLSVRIESPTTRVVVDGPFTVDASFTNTYAIASVDWIWNGTSLGALGVTTGTVDPGALPYGTYSLQLRATDIMGNQACHQRTLFIDQPPSLNVESPLPWRSAAGSLTARANCADDSGFGCTIRLLVDGVPRSQSVVGAGVLDVSIDVSGRDGDSVELTFEATDHRAQPTQVTVTNFVVESAALSRFATPGGEICDVATDRVLYRRDDDVLVAHTVPGATDTAMPVVGANLDCSKSALAPGGAVIITQNRAHHWNAGAINTWISAETRVAGNLATTGSGSTITLRDLVQGTSEVVTAAAGSPVHALAENGAVIYRDTSDNFYRFLPGQSVALIGQVTGPTQQYPITNGTEVLLRHRVSGPDYELLHWDGASLSTLVPSTDLWGSQGPQTGEDYAFNGAYFAYAAPDLLGAYLIWRRQGAGAPQIVTPTGGATEIRGVLSDGRVVYAANGRLVLWSPSAPTRDVGAASGRVMVRGTDIFVVFGYDVYRVIP